MPCRVYTCNGKQCYSLECRFRHSEPFWFRYDVARYRVLICVDHAESVPYSHCLHVWTHATQIYIYYTHACIHVCLCVDDEDDHARSCAWLNRHTRLRSQCFGCSSQGSLSGICGRNDSRIQCPCVCIVHVTSRKNAFGSDFYFHESTTAHS